MLSPCSEIRRTDPIKNIHPFRVNPQEGSLDNWHSAHINRGSEKLSAALRDACGTGVHHDLCFPFIFVPVFPCPGKTARCVDVLHHKGKLVEA